MKPSISFTVSISSDEYTRVRNSELSLDKLLLDKLSYIRRAATPKRVKAMFYEDDHPDNWRVK